MSLCLYQGTFNPIHNAHLKVANFVYKNFNFDKILFIPAYKPPHKNNFECDEELAMHRLNMVNLAVEPFPYFEVSEIEYKRNEPSYTYYTIKELYDIYQPKEKINFIIGTDAFRRIDTWHEADKLKELLDFVLFVREDNFEETTLFELKSRGYNYRLAKMDYCNISSSEVRQKTKNCANIINIVPNEVANYINENKLYKY